jgi:hypothetical protein
MSTAAAAAAAAHAKGVKASGALVQLEPAAFQQLLQHIPEPLVLHQKRGGMLSRHHKYATSYRGFIFLARSPEPLSLPGGADVLPARKIWFPE